MSFPFVDETGQSDGYLVVREEGGSYDWLSYDQWLRTVPYVPIFGVLNGHKARLYDRILEAHGISPWRTQTFTTDTEGKRVVTQPVPDMPERRIFHKTDEVALAFAAQFQQPRDVIEAYLQSLSEKARLNLVRALTYPGIE